MVKASDVLNGEVSIPEGAVVMASADVDGAAANQIPAVIGQAYVFSELLRQMPDGECAEWEEEGR